MKRGLTIVLAALVLLTGCDGDYGDYGDVSALLITDAESLYLAPKPKTEEAAARDAEGNVMFKITKEGIVIEVTFTNDKGETESTEKLKPTALYHANDDYFIVVYDNYDNHGQQMSHLVSKTNGAVYSLGNVGVPRDMFDTFVNSSSVLSDGENNIYFITDINYSSNSNKYQELYRIDVSNPEKVSARPLTGPNDRYIHSFAVDAAGNGIYVYEGNNGNRSARLAYSGGGFANCDYTYYWTAPDGKLYYKGDQVYDETTWEYRYPIYRLDIEGQKVSKTEYGTVNGDFYIDFQSYYLTSGDRAYILDSDGRLFEVYNPEGKPRLVEGVPVLTNIQAVTQSEEELFIAGESDGQPRVIRVNPVSGAWKDLYTPGDYEVYNMVYAGGRLTVNAMRMDDGAIIMGELDGTGKMKVLDETSNSKVLYLTRIK